MRSNIFTNIRPKSYGLLFLLLPVLKFMFDLIIYFSNTVKVRLCDLTYYIHNFILFEFIVIVLVSLHYRKRYRILLRYWQVVLLFIFISGLKIYLIYQQGLILDLVYFIKVLLMTFLEILPLLLLTPYLQRSQTVKLFYIFLMNTILVVNVAFFSYYYNTGEKFEYIIFDNLNTTSIQGAFLNISVLTIAMVVLFLLVFNYFFYRHIQTVHSAKKYFVRLLFSLLALTVFYGILSLSDRYIVGKICTRYGTERPTKNVMVESITSNTFASLVFAYKAHEDHTLDETHRPEHKKHRYTQKEKKVQNKLLQKNAISSDKTLFAKPYTKVVFVIFESLSIDFLNYYNKKIPYESTPYFNHLLKNYFHLNNFYTSNMPTDYGLTAILKSRLDLDMKDKSLLSVLKDQGFRTFFLRGSSKFYSNHIVYYPKAFQYDEGIFQEELIGEYGRKNSGWGFNNQIVYQKAISLMKEHKDDKIAMVVKTIDFHLPGPKCELSSDEIPKGLCSQDDLLKSLLWIDTQLKRFIENMKSANVLDEHTLVVVTADHNPHLGADFKKYALSDNFRRLARIPLIFITKNKDFSSFNFLENRIYSQIDIAPTIASLMHADIPSSFVGRNIFEDGNRSFALGKYKNTGQYINTILDLKMKLDTCEKYNSIEKRTICYTINNALVSE